MMKKYLFLLSSAATAAVLYGCAVADKTVAAPAPQPKTVENTAAKTAPAKTVAKPASATPVAAKPAPAKKSYFAAADAARTQKMSVKPAPAKPAPKPTPEELAKIKAQQTYDNEFNKKVNAARPLVWHNRHEEANKTLPSLLADKKVTPSIRVTVMPMMVDSLNRQKKHEEALKLADKFLADPAVTPRVRVDLLAQKAGVMLALKRYDDAYAVLMERLGGNLNSYEVLPAKRGIAETLENKGDYALAIAHLNEILATPGLKDNDKLTILNDMLRVARKAGDPAQMNDYTARIDALVRNPEKDAWVRLQNAQALERLKKNADADKIRQAILMNKNLPAAPRINAFFCFANQIRNAQRSDKRRIFYLLGNTLLKDSKRNPYLGKPAFADAAAEIAARKTEDLTWTAEAVKELNFPVKDFQNLASNLMTIAQRDVKNTALAGAYAKSILADAETATSAKLGATRILFDHALENRNFAEADRLADRAFTFKDLNQSEFASVCAMKTRVLCVQDKCDEAVAFMRSKMDTPERKNRYMYEKLAGIYQYFFRTEDAVKTYMDAGNVYEALRVMNERYPDKTLVLAEQVLSDTKREEKDRIAAMTSFLSSKPKAIEMRKKYPEILAKVGEGSFYGTARMAATYGDYVLAEEMLEPFLKNATADTSISWTRYFLGEEYMQVSLSTYAALNRIDKIQMLAKKYAAANEKDCPAARKLVASFVAGAFALPQNAAAFQQYYKSYPFEKSVTVKQKSDLLLLTAQLMMNARRFDMAETVHNVYLGLYKPEPKKTYVVKFSDTPIQGVAGFVAMKNQPEKQLMDRKFGGNMDFMTTDVSTGDRGGNIGADQGKKNRPTEMQIVCDENGVHFLFTAYDDKYKDIEAGLAGAGSFEMYLAPGENQPYFCFLPDLSAGTNHAWNTTYNTALWHRLDPGVNAVDMKSERVFTKDGYLFYMFLKWEKFYDKLPENGDFWEFENVHWSRFGGNSWNGIKTVHGRSTWGRLVFSVTPAQMRMVKRHIIYAARLAYQKEKRTSGSYHGAIDRWMNDAQLGDPAFYQQEVAPVTAKLDSALKLVKSDMDDATIDKLYKEAVPGWFGIRYVMDDLRRRYLEKMLSE